MAIEIIVFSGIVYGQVRPKYVDLLSWAGYRDCVDSYMQLDEQSEQDLQKMSTVILANFAISAVILALETFSFISFMCFCCKDRCG